MLSRNDASFFSFRTLVIISTGILNKKTIFVGDIR